MLVPLSGSYADCVTARISLLRGCLILVALATRSRGYTDKTHLRGFETLVFTLIRAVANYIRSKLFKHPLTLRDRLD